MKTWASTQRMIGTFDSQASSGRPPVVVDPKGSPALEATVRAYGGQVWKLDGKLPADLLDPRPHQVSDLLLEAEDYSLDARVFRDAAHQRALWAAWALALQGKPMGLAELRRLLDREASRGGAGAVPTRFAGE